MTQPQPGWDSRLLPPARSLASSSSFAASSFSYICSGPPIQCYYTHVPTYVLYLYIHTIHIWGSCKSPRVMTPSQTTSHHLSSRHVNSPRQGATSLDIRHHIRSNHVTSRQRHEATPAGPGWSRFCPHWDPCFSSRINAANHGTQASSRRVKAVSVSVYSKSYPMALIS